MGIGVTRTGVWACLVGLLLCGCDSNSSSQQEELALFESIEQKCWRYLGGIKSKFEISGKECGILDSSGKQNGRRNSVVLESGGQNGSRGSVDISSEDEEEKQESEEKNPENKGWKDVYVDACQDAIGVTGPFTTAKAIKNGACVPELVQNTCTIYRNANVPKGLENISKLVVLDSLFSGMFMAKCLSVSSSGRAVLVKDFAQESLDAAGEGIKTAVEEAAKTAGKQALEILKEKVMDPNTWKAVAVFAFSIFAK